MASIIVGCSSQSSQQSTLPNTTTLPNVINPSSISQRGTAATHRTKVIPNVCQQSSQRTSDHGGVPNVYQCATPSPVSPVILQNLCMSMYSCAWDGGPSAFNNTDCTGDVACTVGVIKGRPRQAVCNANAKEVDQTIELVAGQPRTVVDENEIYKADGLPFNSGGNLTVNNHVWGFMYKDNAGQYWVQPNPQFTWTTSFSAAINAAFASIGISFGAPTGTTAQGPYTTRPAIPSGQKMVRCFTQGNQWS